MINLYLVWFLIRIKQNVKLIISCDVLQMSVFTLKYDNWLRISEWCQSCHLNLKQNSVNEELVL